MSMESSLALPQDLYWEGKMEPISPPNSGFLTLCEDLSGNWLEGDDILENDIAIVAHEDIELKHHDIDLTKGLLETENVIIEIYDLKEELFYSPTQLLDNSLDGAVTNPNQLVKVENPPNANNFGFPTLDASSVLTQLTPPSSPPRTLAASAPPAPVSTVLLPEPTHLPIDINNVLHHGQTLSEPTSTIPEVQSPFGFVSSWQSQPQGSSDALAEDDIEFHTQIIDDILKSAANEIFVDTESQFSVSAPSQGEYSTTDDEWLPSSGSCSPVQNLCAESCSELSSGVPSPAAPKKRSRPYGRGVEDRKIRKKEQNKNAATRYRQKKKLEMEHILVEEQELSQRHEELKKELAERQREAKYLRTLIREFYTKK